MQFNEKVTDWVMSKENDVVLCSIGYVHIEITILDSSHSSHKTWNNHWEVILGPHRNDGAIIASGDALTKAEAKSKAMAAAKRVLKSINKVFNKAYHEREIPKRYKKETKREYKQYLKVNDKDLNKEKP